MKKILSAIFGMIMLFGFASIVQAAVEGIGDTWWSNPTKIKTYIPPNHKYTAKMKRACHEWSVLTKNGIVFKYVSNIDDAQIKVYFVKKIPENMNADTAIGITQPMYYKNNGKLAGAKVWIADYTSDKRKLSDDEVYTTMLHELGHAIGLDHTQNKKSIMYPNVRYVKTSEITSEELSILSKKYGWKK